MKCKICGRDSLAKRSDCPYCGASVLYPARLFSRISATMVDWIGFPVILILGGSLSSWNDLIWLTPLAFLFNAIVWYAGLAKNGNTYGKLWNGIYIADKEGRIPPANHLFFREIIKIVFLFSPLIIGILWVFFDTEKQGWHDKLFHTYVIEFNAKQMSLSSKSD